MVTAVLWHCNLSSPGRVSRPSRPFYRQAGRQGPAAASGERRPPTTARHREGLRSARVARFDRKSRKRSGALLHEVTPNLHARRDERGAFWACARCGTELGGSEDNCKLGCNREDRHISESNPLIGEPHDFVDDDVEFRQFSCPSCGTLIENEVAIASDPVLHDIALRVSALPRRI